MDSIVHGVAKSQTQLSNFHFHTKYIFELYIHIYKTLPSEYTKLLIYFIYAQVLFNGEGNGNPYMYIWQPFSDKLYSPWNSPSQNTGAGSLSLLQGNLPNPGIEPRSPALQVDSLPAEPQGKYWIKPSPNNSPYRS